LPFHIDTYALEKVVGESLGKVEDKLPYAIYFISKMFSKFELNFIVTEKEL